jgi:hypothetical protein
MADDHSSYPSDELVMMPLSGWPMPSLHPFVLKDVVALFGQFALVLMSALTFRRKPRLAAPVSSAPPAATRLAPTPKGGRRPTYGHPSLGTTLHFRFLHVASFLVVLPVIAATRLLPSHWRKRHEQSVFVETNHAVLTALGFAFMA